MTSAVAQPHRHPPNPMALAARDGVIRSAVYGHRRDRQPLAHSVTEAPDCEDRRAAARAGGPFAGLDHDGASHDWSRRYLAERVAVAPAPALSPDGGRRGMADGMRLLRQTRGNC